MHNLLRTLVYDNQVSLTLADTTGLVKEGVRLHGLSKDAAYVFGKTLSAMAFMSACLKNERGEISWALKTDGVCGDIGVSGNHALYLRGYILNTQASGSEGEVLGSNGALTIIRDDGYTMPFVGSCALKDGAVDASFEEYFTISEQLPTRITTLVEINEKGECTFAGVAALQLLPFADESTQKQVSELPLTDVVADVKNLGVQACANKHFNATESACELRNAQYECNCSRSYLLGVLASLGEPQMRQIIAEDGELKVHCHYCNTDYVFTDKDADELFSRK